MNKVEAKLVADIGGTHARFALCTSKENIHDIEVVPCANFPTLEQAIRYFLAGHGNPSVRQAVIGIANPVLGDEVKMTNFAWTFSIEQTRRSLGLETLKVINDFMALALSLPHLAPHQLRQIGGGVAIAGTPLGVLGPGTGLGVSGLIPAAAGEWVPLAGEGGHVDFAPADEREKALWEAGTQRYGHISMERLLSGPGLEFIYDCMAKEIEPASRAESAEQISLRAIAGTDVVCKAALDSFCAILGTAASDLALTLGARGGIYIGGGIIPKLGDYFFTSPFRQRFENKGRFASYLAAIPVYVIVDGHPGLLGAAALLDGPTS